MSLESTLSDIIARLRQGRFPNEQSISQGIVLRILQELAWDTWDTAIVYPEYRTTEGRADFALCHPANRPAIFIEVKAPGRAEDAVRQALDYAFHSGGVPFVILTDGKTWSFYLTMEQGSYEDRRVYKLDLFERDPAEACAILKKYLTHESVASGLSLETARAEYRNRNRRAQARAAIPEAWAELVEKGEELLVELLANTVESKAGVRPDEDDVTTFLLTLHPSGVASASPPPPARVRQSPPPRETLPPVSITPPPDLRTPPPQTTRSGHLTLLGQRHPYANAKDAMIFVLRALAEKDTTFLQRCSQHPDIQGKQRKYIGRTPEELYPHREDLREMVESLPGGWLVMTNLNNATKRNVIRVAAEVAGLHFGRDVSVEF